MMQLEAKAYGPDSTPTEVQAIQAGGNFIINGVAKLLLKNSGVRNLTMCKDEAEALAVVTGG